MYTLPSGEKYYYKKPALYYDASVEYFSGSHLYYGIVAIFVGVFFGILPLVFLVIYPMRWFQKSLNFCHIQRQSIDIFINCYQGYYKDGTNGTKDYRYFSVTFFLIQIGTMGLYTLSKSSFCFSLAAISLIILLFITLVVQPYKEQFKAYNVIDAFMIFFLGLLNVVAIAADEAKIKAAYFHTGTNVILGFISLVPLIYYIVLCIWWIFVKRELKNKIPCFHGKDSSTQQSRSQEFDDLPDRIENPSMYKAQAAPLLFDQEHDPCQDVKYGATLSSTQN